MQICAARKKKRGSLRSPSIITTLCKAFDVPIADEEEKLKIKGTIILVSIARFSQEKTEPDATNTSSVQT